MSTILVTVGKKAAEIIASNPKVLKKILGVVLAIIIALMTPLIAIIAIVNGDISFDADRLQELVSENLSEEEKARFQMIEETMYEIQERMAAAEYDGQRIKEAQVLFALALPDFADDASFVERLTACFTREQTDQELINAVNAEFGTEIKVEDFTQLMQTIRSNYINANDFVAPETKNNLDLVLWAKRAKAAGWGYVWGTYGDVLTSELLEAKARQYPDELDKDLDFIQRNWLGGRTADCVGLIKGYGWLDAESSQILIGSHGMPDIGSDSMYEYATEKGPINTMPEIPGLAVWQPGHIGIYIGEGKVIEAKTTKVGVIETELQRGHWTHWLKIPYIEYIEEKNNS